MSNKNLLTIDVSTRWNSTYDMITTAWDKRKVLKATTCLKGGKGISLIMLSDLSYCYNIRSIFEI